MKTYLITGGTDGLGKGIAMHLLEQGERVIAVSSSSAKGELFIRSAEQLGAKERAVFIQADLSLVSENKRIINEVTERFAILDGAIFCAANLKHRKSPIITKEGFELTFALHYLSRFLLGYGLKEILKQSNSPIIVNICAPGMKGNVRWNDLQFKNKFNCTKCMLHGSRLNDLLGVSFSQREASGKIKYVLFNPWLVQTNSAMEGFGSNFLIVPVYKIFGKPVEEAIKPVLAFLQKPPKDMLTAYKEQKKVSLDMNTFDKSNAKRLHRITSQFVDALKL